LGSSISISSTLQSAPTSRRTAARVFIGSPHGRVNAEKVPVGGSTGQFAGIDERDYRSTMPDEHPPETDDMVVVKTSRSPEELADRLGVWLAEVTGDPAATVKNASSPDANGMSSESVFFNASFNGESGLFVARLAPADEDVPVFPSTTSKNRLGSSN
jgi:hypothetical protein